MVLKSNRMPLTIGVWVEYPILAGYDAASIQQAVHKFRIGFWSTAGGFVEFNVDLDKWRVIQDPNLPHISNAKMIALAQMGIEYAQTGFPLDEPEVEPKFYNWQGNPLP